MTAPQSDSGVGLKERFHLHFQHEVSTLREQIEALSTMSVPGGERTEAVDNCLAGVDRLSHEVKDASGYIPAYDQRTYSEAIKALSEKLQNARNTFNPPKKFSFKARKATSAAPVVHAEHAPASQTFGASVSTPDSLHSESTAKRTQLDKQPPNAGEKQQDTARDPIDDDGISNTGPGIRRPSFAHTAQITISNHSGLHIVAPAAASHATSSGTISNLHRCIVDLSAATANSTPFAALYLKNITDSLVICGQVAGAIHITDISDSVLVTSCRQFRMHGSKNVDVYLHATSRPIFEDCEGLRFAPLPERYVTEAIAQLPNQWDQIDDFKWLKAEPSPHFSILSGPQRVVDDVWMSKMLSEDIMSVDDILATVRR